MLNVFTFYHQPDTMDCGPTCLRMVAKHYGKNYSLKQLRAKSYITREGVSMLGISDAAEAIGFRTLGVKVPFEKLVADAPLPLIVHWNQNHFAVVYKLKKEKVWVADPAVGLISYTKEEFLRSWLSTSTNGTGMGLALLLEPTPSFYENESDLDANTRMGFAYLLGYLRTYKRFILQLLLGLMLSSLIQLILPFLTQSIVDVGINTRNIPFIYLVLAGQLMLFVGRTVAEFLRRWILLHLGTRINLSIISDFLMKLMKLPMSFFDSKMIGDILQRVEDHSRIERFLSSSSLSILFSFFNLFVFGVVLAFYNIPIFLIFFGASALYIGYVLLFLKIRKDQDYKRFNILSRNRSSLIQLVNGMQEIKLNNAELSKRWEWERIQASLFQVNVASTRLQQWQEGGSLFINELKNIFITFVAATAVISGSMTLGMMLAVQYIIGQLNGPINEFVNFIRELQDARISLDRIGEIRLLENEEKPNNTSFAPFLYSQNQSISLQGVSHQYEGPHSPKALDSVDLTIEHGKVTAIVGASGSGKTTLLKLLLKFYEPIEGRIFLGHGHLALQSAREWRSRCGTVMQDGYIFSDTIARNICVSDEDIDAKKMVDAARVANIHEFVESLPLGYDTKIGADGVGVSAGQKQRILIARAVYKNPEYIFFDEATSALDANNEKVIMNNLNDFFKNKTVVVIAHRLSTVRNADNIVVLDKGKVIEQGTHEELAERRGSYFELVKNQLELGN
ncbi:MAG: peptidase domain-containing ABC transporter [Cyclobacteriaceae bacterium]|jgi:ATP-binding cassette subfamily B protein